MTSSTRTRCDPRRERKHRWHARRSRRHRSRAAGPSFSGDRAASSTSANAEMDDGNGRGWAVLRGDELHGMLYFHQGDESDFVARKA